MHDTFGKIPTLIVTKYDHTEDAPKHAKVVQSAHPVPDEASLAGGAAIQDAIAKCGKDAHLLFLVSGGASSLAEVLPAGITNQRRQSTGRLHGIQGYGLCNFRRSG